MSPPPKPSALAGGGATVATATAAGVAGEEADDDAEEVDDAVDDGHDDVADAVDDGHDCAADGAESTLDARDDGAHFDWLVWFGLIGDLFVCGKVVVVYLKSQANTVYLCVGVWVFCVVFVDADERKKKTESTLVVGWEDNIPNFPHDLVPFL